MTDTSFTAVSRAIYNVTAVIVMLSVCVTGCGSGDSPPRIQEAVSRVTFAAIGNSGYALDSGRGLRDLAGVLNEYGVDFTVDLGNAIPRGAPSGGLQSLWDAVDQEHQLFAAPVYPVAGRDDIFDYESDITYSRCYGPLWYSFRRNGIVFVTACTEDEAWRHGFGTSPVIGPEQRDWLTACFRDAGSSPLVVFMHRPVWEDSPVVWNREFLPLFHEGGVNLIVTANDRGLMDWGTIDGIRTVSTGCVGPVRETAPGLMPHALLVTVDENGYTFAVLAPDGSRTDGIPVDNAYLDSVDELVGSFRPPIVKAEPSWRISSSTRLSVQNRFGVPVTGSVDFTVYDTTTWRITPEPFDFLLDNGMTRTIRLGVEADLPELGPQPRYTLGLAVDGRTIHEESGDILVSIPEPRTGEVVPVTAVTADIVPYAFGGELRVPVTVEGFDECGRLIIYRDMPTGPPVCIHVAPLRDFTHGINEFVWNGRDLNGDPVPPDTLSFRVVVYNKKAPVTWVARGPENEYGAFEVMRRNGELVAVTHTSREIGYYRIGGSPVSPKPFERISLDVVLGDEDLLSFVRDENGRYFLLTGAGIACVTVEDGIVAIDNGFGEDGYVRLTDYRGRRFGGVSYAEGLVYAGIGGSAGLTPRVIALDCFSGEIAADYDCGDWFGESTVAPGVGAWPGGVVFTHPDIDQAVAFDHSGRLLWVADSENNVLSRDRDDRAFTFAPGVDGNGFVYIATPGGSARSGVIGPDGHGLFRVILVQLPGLRVGSAVPCIEGQPTDGLYFVTRGGDIPYVFHVPYTVRTGMIVDERTLRE